MIRDHIKHAVENAIAAAQACGDLPAFAAPAVTLAKPRPEMGDYAASVAMQLARVAKMAPPIIAQRIAKQLPPNAAYTAEVAAGYLNFRLTAAYLAGQVNEILQAGDQWGNTNLGNGQKAQVEHGSANPTGYATIGTARNVTVGDTLANTLEAAGYVVHREWYVNDAGSQVKKFGASIYARYCQHLGKDEPMPDGGYMGDDVAQTAQRIADKVGNQYLQQPREQAILALGRLGIDSIMDSIRATLLRMNIRYDNFFSEKSLYTSGQSERALALLRAKNLLVEHDEALWFSEDGSPIRKGQGKKKTDAEYANQADADPDADNESEGEVDEAQTAIQAVVVRSAKVISDPDERATYFCSDIPYVWNKVHDRGFNPAVYVWGEDHQADVTRVHAAARALGLNDDAVKILIYRFITLMSGGQEVRMGKRKGNAIWIDDVLDETGPDALRYIMLSRSIDTKIVFDLDLLKEQNDKNPVFYVQYAHARICSIERKVEEQGQSQEPRAKNQDLSTQKTEEDNPKSKIQNLKFEHVAELNLIRKLLELPEIVEMVATSLQPHHYITYAREIAQAFSTFYENCRILDAAPDVAAARLQLAKASRLTLAKVLRLMGITAPEKM
ncbi:MAG: arginine--tRNA ligase [Chloroflexota bacterium]|jgi:arginyl-tRNA synthetase